MPDDTTLTDPSTISPDHVRLHQRLTEQLERSEQQLVGLESVLSDMHKGHDTIQEDRDSTRLVVDSIRDDVRRIRSALARLADGTYGRCVTCGSTINPERLEAIPSADHCTRCA
jgi:RNA polymerase-binding transcription factor DksA